MGREDDLLLRVREVWCYCFPGLRPGGHPSPKPGLAQDTASWEPPGSAPRPRPWALDAWEKRARLTGSPLGASLPAGLGRLRGGSRGAAPAAAPARPPPAPGELSALASASQARRRAPACRPGRGQLTPAFQGSPAPGGLSRDPPQVPPDRPNVPAGPGTSGGEASCEPQGSEAASGQTHRFSQPGPEGGAEDQRGSRERGAGRVSLDRGPGLERRPGPRGSGSGACAGRILSWVPRPGPRGGRGDRGHFIATRSVINDLMTLGGQRAPHGL